MNLSAWELNQKKPHPKHLENIISYLGYIPKIDFEYENLGMVTKLFRMKNNVSFDTMCQMTNIDSHVVMKLENARFCKVNLELNSMVINSLKTHAHCR